MPESYVEIPLPPETAIDPNMVASAWFSDCYQAALTQPALSVTDLFEAVLGHSPRWLKALLILRNRIAARAGLTVAPDALIQRFDRRPTYAVGETIGPWPIYHLSDTELIAGRDNGHLDFRLSVLKREVAQPTVTISTVCRVHNVYGKLYLLFIIPFHRWGMRKLMQRAVSAGRL
jgi:hypothetical protein